MKEAIAWALVVVGGLAAWLWLWIGHARGDTKRIAFRAFLLALASGVLLAGRSAGIFQLVSPGLALLLGAIVVLVVVGNLFGVRFCDTCGRMNRDLRAAACSRCGFGLSQHGLTQRRKRARMDPTDPLGRKRAPRH